MPQRPQSAALHNSAMMEKALPAGAFLLVLPPPIKGGISGHIEKPA
jgi:hypothetical protein